MNITPDNITELKENEIFVFGSNESGRHGKGAAKTALGFGAKWGRPSGLWGKTYAIPTKDASIRRTLALSKIEAYVRDFTEFARENQQYIFLVTEIGCGLAGLVPKDIAPMFKEASKFSNVYLPKRFWHKLKDSHGNQEGKEVND